MITLICHHTPQLFRATAPGQQPFACTDSFICKFLFQELGWVPRVLTRAAQKSSADAQQKIFKLFVRLSLWVHDSGTRHPDLIINFNQTQIVISDNSARTFDTQGSKQIAVLGKEEKCAFTAVVGVSASGAVLPLQFIFKGGSD
ncbi:hypothetical protein CONPUDRAFT_156691 [Coniophora puteana RWD-64-598 SS2]|uniref:DDE-1 domain-containing protein n=1 Tax=Coniophora puteana (strain RWD-64-598) TaxID=741705 RepID=A0A5M3MI16_CONPW|nr:uncharacterized protein CONPUDRAFT_156691 [Coniophora puteana RWD-64-598 SS2]EIW78733.1 hypothetical protein CONPUDRAFT_156691 [Coniophora puteana RWD-64-598 SS2]